MATVLRTTGLILSLLPYNFLEFLTEFLGMVFITLPSARRRILFSNLSYAFPKKAHKEIKRIAQQSAARMFEMGFFQLCYPFLGRENLRRTVLFTANSEEKMRKLRKGEAPVLIMIPHVCLFETLATSPSFRPQGGKVIGAIYRPNKNRSLDKLINSARLSVGIETFSRHAGFSQTRAFLKQKNWLAVLFDQNAGTQGTLCTFLDRVASITTLPDILKKASDARAIYVNPKREGFFRSKIEIVELKNCSSIASASHEILAKQILSHPNGLPEWLWCHSKWKTQYYPHVKFGLKSKRNHLPEVLPKKLVFIIRMPNWLGDIMMSLPTLHAICKARRDVRFIILCKSQYKPLLNHFGVGDKVVCQDSIFTFAGIKSLLALRKLFPECHFLFTNSFSGDLEAKLIGSTHRFGLKLPGRYRPLLTHSFKPAPKSFHGKETLHQSKLWEEMAKHFGLNQAVDYRPLAKPIKPNHKKLGIVLGSENTPAKRWSSRNWLELCRLFLELEPSFDIYLYGTAKEKTDAEKISMDLNSDRLRDLSGKTNLLELVNEFLTCEMVIGCDSGGAHLSNALGIKTAILFGPTNALRTKPCYSSSTIVIKPNKFPKSVEAKVSWITPCEVFKKCISFLKKTD